MVFETIPLSHSGTPPLSYGTGCIQLNLSLFNQLVNEIAVKIVDEALTVHKVLGRGKHLGFLINFNVPLIKNGINRIIL